MHRGTLDEREARVLADRVREPDPAVRGMLATEPRRHEPLGVTEQPLARLAAALELDAERGPRHRREPVQDERDVETCGR